MEQLQYNLLFGWFTGLSPDDPVWVAESFGKNRERLESHDLIRKFMTGLLRHETVRPLLSSEHFPIDGTLVEAWASHKSFRPKVETGGGEDQNGGTFRGKPRRNDTHDSKTDPEARLYRKAQGREARLACPGHVLIERGVTPLMRVVVSSDAMTLASRSVAGSLREPVPVGQPTAGKHSISRLLRSSGRKARPLYGLSVRSLHGGCGAGRAAVRGCWGRMESPAACRQAQPPGTLRRSRRTDRRTTQSVRAI